MEIGLIILIIALIGIGVVMLGSGGKKHSGESKSDAPQGNQFERLRQEVLNFKPDSGLGQPSGAPDQVYGVVMDWYVGNGVATLACLENGDASIYFSGGVVMTPGFGDSKVRDLTRKYIAGAQHALMNCTKVGEFPLPDPQTVRFYLLTRNGVHCGIENMAQFQSGHSKWFPLFIDANEIFAEIRKSHEQRSKA